MIPEASETTHVYLRYQDTFARTASEVNMKSFTRKDSTRCHFSGGGALEGCQIRDSPVQSLAVVASDINRPAGV